MSPIDLKNLRAEYPEYEVVWDRLEEWMASHASYPFLDPRLLVRKWSDTPIDALAEVLSILVQRHVLKRVYKVESPYDKRLLEPDYESRDAVRPPVRDYRDRAIDIEEAEIVPVFRGM